MSGGKPDEGNWAVAIGMADGTTFQFRCDDEQSMRAECQRIKTIWVGVVDEEIKEMDAKKNVQSTALNHVEKFVAEQRRTGEMDDIED